MSDVNLPLNAEGQPVERRQNTTTVVTGPGGILVAGAGLAKDVAEMAPAKAIQFLAAGMMIFICVMAMFSGYYLIQSQKETIGQVTRSGEDKLEKVITVFTQTSAEARQSYVSDAKAARESYIGEREKDRQHELLRDRNARDQYRELTQAFGILTQEVREMKDKMKKSGILPAPEECQIAPMPRPVDLIRVRSDNRQPERKS